VRLDMFYHTLHAFHDTREVEGDVRRVNPELPGAAHMRQQPCGPDECFRRHAARVQAVAAHAVLLNQCDLRFDCGRDVGADEAG
jgi:hypothetical protein